MKLNDMNNYFIKQNQFVWSSITEHVSREFKLENKIKESVRSGVFEYIQFVIVRRLIMVTGNHAKYF